MKEVCIRCFGSAAVAYLSEAARLLDEYDLSIADLQIADKKAASVQSGYEIGTTGKEGMRVIISELTADNLRRAAETLAEERFSSNFSVYGLSLSEVTERLSLLEARDAHVFCRPHGSTVTVFVRYGETTPKVSVDATLAEIERLLSDAIFARENCGLEKAIIKTLLDSRRRIAVAESFTGGNVSAALSGVAGASGAFFEGIVAYNEVAKSERLGVDAKMLAFHSAVSINAAFQMAAGLLRTHRAEVVAATTGYAGPTGPEVGKCFIAVGDRIRINVFEHHFTGTRDEITAAGTACCLEHIMDYLKGKIKN